jgi:hypothetical protein
MNANSTPETDNELEMWRDGNIIHENHLDFARQLERERDELREAINRQGYKLAGFEAVEAGLRAENEAMRNALRLAESAAAAAFNERDRLASENERLQAHLDELTAATIHSCGDHCQRPNCVRRREMAVMREAIREAYYTIKESPYPDQQALVKLQPFVTTP